VDLTAVAAFTAAALSLVNVAYSYHLSKRGNREQWWREQERPIVARSLTLSGDALLEWRWASVAKQAMSEDEDWAGSEASQHWEKGWRLMMDLRYEVAQLDLLASRPVRKAARELVGAHVDEGSRYVDAQSGQDDDEGWGANLVKIEELQDELVEITRADLGLGPGFQVPPNSFLATLLNRNPARRAPHDDQE
jgi:hypothetical protein